MSITWTININKAAAPTKNPIVFTSSDKAGIVAKQVNSLPITVTKNTQKMMVVTVFKAFFSFCEAEPGDAGMGTRLQRDSFS